MKRGKPEEEQPKREPSLWISVLKAVIPLFAAVLSAAFVLLCVVYGRMHPSLTIELSEMTPEAKAFLRLDTADAAYVFEPEERYQKAGDYRLKIHTGVINAPVTLHVRDTVAPTADGTERSFPSTPRLRRTSWSETYAIKASSGFRSRPRRRTERWAITTPWFCWRTKAAIRRACPSR